MINLDNARSILDSFEEPEIEYVHILLLVGQTTEWNYVIALSAYPLNRWLLIRLSDFTDTLYHFIQDEVSVAHLGDAHLVTKIIIRV